MFNTSLLNVADIAKIGIMAFTFIWIANKVLDRTGLGEFKS